MFLNSNEQFHLLKNTYVSFAILTVVFMKKTVLWRVTTYTLIYRCQRLSRPCRVRLYLDHTEEDVTSSLKCCKLYTSLHGVILEEWHFQ